MASGFEAYAIPDSHITFLQEHPGFVHSYLDGEKPDEVDSASLPEWWPQQAPKSLGSWGINHRNIELYHWILNGGPELATGSGSIFQTWYEPDTHNAVKLDPHNERFAFHVDQIAELDALVARMDVPTVKSAFTAWCRSRGDQYEPDDMACLSFTDEFGVFHAGLQEAMRNGHGIVW